MGHNNMSLVEKSVLAKGHCFHFMPCSKMLLIKLPLPLLWSSVGFMVMKLTLLAVILTPPPIEKKIKYEYWQTAGPRPRPLPPPLARPKSYNVEGWWDWVAESDNVPESTVMELRTNAHKLLWEAIDYVICVEADVFITGFDSDCKGHPNFASLVTGHRLYQSVALKTYRLDR